MISPFYCLVFNLCICDFLYLKIKDIHCHILKLNLYREGCEMKRINPSQKKKNYLKVDYSLKCKSQNYKAFRKKHRRKNSGFRAGKEFSDLTPKAQSVKGKLDKLNLIKIKTFALQKPMGRV